ncbi:4-carboxymuconolactone decarboxylase [Klebsiella quasipneumoniae]|uniref:carboxymuconolactone decarboxylase family protein n=1 Tax=Klebsiella quasipneumoniae TaxID=1463165 RepID=UPI00218131CA|nr:carboxymuconolactone decarboxylase family protein [Klebsiella quasipneumoniae]GKP97495.1 4-carboxymuconolactone decarboxylase [Klebsiella quasipneumoniae]
MDTTPVDRHTLAAISPKLAELTETVLFGDIWARSELSPRERSLITLSALTALGKTEQLSWHIAYGYRNGLSQEEIVELFTHLAFYAGWPAAASALTCLNAQEAPCL